MTLSPTLNLYKNLLKLAKNLPAASRQESIAKIQAEFRRNTAESDPEQVQKLIKHAESSLGYLKIVTPRTTSNSQSGHTKIVFGSADNKSTQKAVSNWTGKNMDPDAVKRHYQGLKRAGYKNNSDAKGFF